MTRARRRRIANGARFAAAVAITAVFLFPLYWIAATSLKSSSEIFTIPPTWAPQRLNFVNYIQVFEGGEIRALWNSLAVSSVSSLAAMLIGTLAAYSMARSTPAAACCRSPLLACAWCQQS